MPDPKTKIARMVQPEPLRSETYQPWLRGRGVDVWAMICAAIAGDLETIKSLLGRDPGLINCQIEYFKPIRFAVRENQRAVVEHLLAQGDDPADEAGESLLEIARLRGHGELALRLESLLQSRYNIRAEADRIMTAIKDRDANQVRALLAAHPDLVHAADRRGNQPLHWAVMTRQIDLIDFLIEQGADLNAARPDGLRPLHLTNGDYHYRGWRDLPATALQKQEMLIGYLLARGAFYDLSTATKLGDLDRVRQLLDESPSLLNQVPTYSYYTGLPLRNAAAAGHLEVVKLLLARGADPNAPEPGIAPMGGALHAAIGGKHLEVIKLLLERGANPNAEVESSGNCLSMAKHVNAAREIQDLIISHGGVMGSELADLETLGAMLWVNPALPVSERLDDPDRTRLLLRYQPDLLKQRPDPTAWWSSATPKSPEFARWLMERGLDPNRPNWLGVTLLHRCAAKGDVELAKVCLEFGGDLNVIETEWSSTPLAWAARENKKAMVQWLLANGARADLPTDEPWALPAEWARRKGHLEVLELLRTS